MQLFFLKTSTWERGTDHAWHHAPLSTHFSSGCSDIIEFYTPTVFPNTVLYVSDCLFVCFAPLVWHNIVNQQSDWLQLLYKYQYYCSVLFYIEFCFCCCVRLPNLIYSALSHQHDDLHAGQQPGLRYLGGRVRGQGLALGQGQTSSLLKEFILIWKPTVA